MLHKQEAHSFPGMRLRFVVPSYKIASSRQIIDGAVEEIGQGADDVGFRQLSVQNPFRYRTRRDAAYGRKSVFADIRLFHQQDQPLRKCCPGNNGRKFRLFGFSEKIIDGTIHEIGDEKDVFEGRGIGSVQPSCNAAFQTADFAGKRGGRHVVEDNKLSDGIRKMGGGGFHNSFSVA